MYVLSSFITELHGKEMVSRGNDVTGSSTWACMVAPVKAKPAHFNTERRVNCGAASAFFDAVFFLPISFRTTRGAFHSRRRRKNQAQPTCNAIASPMSCVVEFPPISGVRTLQEARIAAIADSMASAASVWLRWRSIMAPDHIL